MENLYPLKRLKKVLFQGSIKKDREKGKLHQNILSSGVNLTHSNEDIWARESDKLSCPSFSFVICTNIISVVKNKRSQCWRGENLEKTSGLKNKELTPSCRLNARTSRVICSLICKKTTGGKSVAVTNQPPSWNRIKTYARIFLSGNFSEIDLGICIGNLHSNSHKFPDLPYTSLAR